jgi:nitrite reductase/ring-hydroxylating ferredoxin subunit
LIRDEVDINLDSFVTELAATPTALPLAENAFRPNQLQPGQITLVHVNSERVAVYNVDGTFYATQERCTHVGGPLSEGRLDGKLIVCPWHDSCFDVTDGHVECGPATVPVKTYRVIVEGDTAHVEE